MESLEDDFLDDPLAHDSYDLPDDLDNPWGPTEAAVEAEEPAADLEASAPAITSSEEAPPPPALSLEERLAAVARGAASTPNEPAAPTYSQDALRIIALNDPERYAELRDQGRSLEKLAWGPDRHATEER